MGNNIGVRIIDEFLAKSAVTSCANFRETAEMIGKVAFKMFIGVTAEVTNWNPEGNACSLILQDNPFTDFVELPPQYAELQYCNILCGIIKGALEMVQMQVECRFVRDLLRGDECTELRVEFKGLIGHEMSDEYKEN
jgi:trafficking protein particle complex subunit 3